RAEPVAVLGCIDAFGTGAEDIYAGRGQAHGEIVWYLTTHADHNPVGPLVLTQVQHRLQTELIEVQSITDIVVGTHRLRIVVQHYRLVPDDGGRPCRIDRAPVELHARAHPAP